MVGLVDWARIDSQLFAHAARLAAAVRLTEAESLGVATLIAAEIAQLPLPDRERVVAASPVTLQARLDELRAFQGWMDLSRDAESNPVIARARVLAQNYICFVYLSEACFRVLRKVTPAGSVTKRCCTFLTDNPVRAFRNAIAHSNWTYQPDFSGLTYWAYKDSPLEDRALDRFDVGQDELDFWQALSRCVAYTAYTTIAESPDQPAASI